MLRSEVSVDWSRRRLLVGSACASVTGLAAGRAHAGGGLTGRLVPGATQPFRILEIFFAGAPSFRDTWWVERPLPGSQRPAKVDVLDGLDLSAEVRLTSADAAFGASLAAPDEHRGPAWKIGDGNRQFPSSAYDVHLGPCFKPFVDPLPSGARLRDRLRVVAVEHGNVVHEVAVTLMTHGDRALTAPRRASGLGGTLHRFHRPIGAPPTSVVLYNDRSDFGRNVATTLVESAAHGGEHQPGLLPYSVGDLTALDPSRRDAARDALVEHYVGQYDARLVFANPLAAGIRARSLSFDAFRAAWDDLHTGPYASVVPVLGGTSTDLTDNAVTRGLRAALQLLRTGFQYCGVVDTGLLDRRLQVAPATDNHDSHTGSRHENAVARQLNLLVITRALRQAVVDGELDLDQTLVIFNTEFGRTFLQPDVPTGTPPGLFDGGSEHSHGGFAVAFLGGPIAAGRGGVVGDLEYVDNLGPVTMPADVEPFWPAYASLRGPGLTGGAPLTPTDLRAVALQAGGVQPFQPQLFQTSESRLSGADPAVGDQLCELVFGL